MGVARRAGARAHTKPTGARPLRSIMMQSPHFVSLMRMGFFCGGDISLMQVLDLQSLKQVSDDVGGSTMQTQRTGLMHVSPAENAVRVETVVLAGGHRDEMAADGVVATVLDLPVESCQVRFSSTGTSELTL